MQDNPSEFQSPRMVAAASGSGSRRKAKQTDKKESQMAKALAATQAKPTTRVLEPVASQASAVSSQCPNRDYLLSLQSFRFCLRSLPLIKQLSAGMLEQRTRGHSSHTGNEASSQSSQLSIIGH